MENEKDSTTPEAQGKMGEVARIIAEVVASLSERFVTYDDAKRIAEDTTPSELLNMDKAADTGGDILTRGKSQTSSQGSPTAFWGKAVTAIKAGTTYLTGIVEFLADTGIVISNDAAAKTVKIGMEYPPTLTAKAITSIYAEGGRLKNSYFPTVVASNGAQVTGEVITGIVNSVNSFSGTVGVIAGAGITIGASGNNITVTNANPFPANGYTGGIQIVTSVTWTTPVFILSRVQLNFVGGLLTSGTNLPNTIITTAEPCA